MENQFLCLAFAVIVQASIAMPLWSHSDTDDAQTSTEIAPGNVFGTWAREGSPYYISGPITIPNDSTLSIEPGVEVVFRGCYELNVQGRFLAVGNEQDSIVFTAENVQTGWHGIRFINTPNTNDTSKIMYCVLRNGRATAGSGTLNRCGGAMVISRFDKVFVARCLFDSNVNSGDYSSTGGAAIYIEGASPRIVGNTFSNNAGTSDCAICCVNGSPIISENVFSHNRGRYGAILCLYGTAIISENTIINNVATRAGGGIFCMTSRAIIANNIICRNQCIGGDGEGGGIKSWVDDEAAIINNTIVFNSAVRGGGICCNANSHPTLLNTILWGNMSPEGEQVCIMDIFSVPRFFSCDVQGGKEAFGGYGAGVNNKSHYEQCIESDPLFMEPESDDYRLSDSSPCIGAGSDSAQCAGAWRSAPAFCIDGNPRPSPAGTRPDIGAYENLAGSPVPGLVYAHDVLLSRYGRDTVGISAHIENPLAHVIYVAAILTSGSGMLLDSLILADDGLHGDGSSADGMWGCMYVPGKDDTLRVSIRTADLTTGTSRRLLNIVHMVFTRGPMITMDTRSTDLGAMNDTLLGYDTTFAVHNIGFAVDSLTVTLDPGNVVPDSALAVSPDVFTLASGAWREVSFSVQPRLLPSAYYSAGVIVESKAGYGQRMFEKVFLFQKVMTGAKESSLLPAGMALSQNYPNPFNPTTVVSGQWTADSRVRLVVYDLLGREIAVLADGRYPAGRYSFTFDGSGLASGIYFCRMTAGHFSAVRKMTLAK